MVNRKQLVMLRLYYTDMGVKAYGYSGHLPEFPSVLDATGDTLDELIENIKVHLRDRVAKLYSDREVPWRTPPSVPPGWEQMLIHVRIRPAPIVRWYHRVIGGLLYTGGWLLLHGIYAIEQFAEWVESKRRKS